MSFVNAEPETISAAAGSMAGIGDSMQAGTAAAAGPTTSVVPPGSDIVSAFAATHFVAHAQMFQAVAEQAAAVHQQIVATMSGNSASYAAAEAVNATAAG